MFRPFSSAVAVALLSANVVLASWDDNCCGAQTGGYCRDGSQPPGYCCGTGSCNLICCNCDNNGACLEPPPYHGPGCQKDQDCLDGCQFAQDACEGTVCDEEDNPGCAFQCNGPLRACLYACPCASFSKRSVAALGLSGLKDFEKRNNTNGNGNGNGNFNPFNCGTNTTVFSNATLEETRCKSKLRGLDLDGDGEINKQEWLSHVLGALSLDALFNVNSTAIQRHITIAMAHFDKFDSDSSGTVNFEEAMQSIG